MHAGYFDASGAKVLADWNGLMIAAMANAARVFDRPDWLDSADSAFAFVRDRMQEETDGTMRLKHSFRAGKLKHSAPLDDYANMAPRRKHADLREVRTAVRY